MKESPNMNTNPKSETDAEDNVEEPETGSETETDNEETDPETGEDSEEEISKVTPREKELRRLLRENEKELKSLRKNEEDERKATLSETEKLREELSEKDERLSKLIRQTIAAEHGLDEALAARLVGVTEEELREDAKSLAALVKPPKPKSHDVGLGGVSGSDDTPTDPVAAHRAATAGRRF
jgi:hypothetical protein